MVMLVLAVLTKILDPSTSKGLLYGTFLHYKQILKNSFRNSQLVPRKHNTRKTNAREVTLDIKIEKVKLATVTFLFKDYLIIKIFIF